MEAKASPDPKPRRALPEFLNVPWAMGEVAVVGAAYVVLIPAAITLALVAVAVFVPAVGQIVSQLAHGNAVAPEFGLELAIDVAALGVIWAYLRKYKVGWRAAGWRRPVNVWRTLAYLVLIMIGFITVVTLVLTALGLLVHGFNPNQPQNNDFTQGASTHPGIALLALVLLPPVLEETIFRGFIFPAIAKRTGVVWGAVLSSALFGIAHWQANISVYTFVLGLVLCLMYVKFKSIVPGIGLHMLNNLFALLALTSK